MGYIQSHTDINPDGITDEMSKVYVDNSEAVLRLGDCIIDTGLYTLQFWIKSTHSAEIELVADGLYKLISTGEQWHKYVYTFTVNDTYDSSIYFKLKSGVYYFYHVKLEPGNTATDWTPRAEIMRLYRMSANDSYLLYRLSDRYSDKLGCENGLWYVERNTQLVIINGSEQWVDDGITYYCDLDMVGDPNAILPALCDRFVSGTDYNNLPADGFIVLNSENTTRIYFNRDNSVSTTLDEFKTWLSSTGVAVLIPSEPVTTVLANYLQTMLSNIQVKDSLSVYMDGDIRSMIGTVLVDPVVFGIVNSDRVAVINNVSDEEIGMIYQIHCKGDVLNPVIYHTESNTHLRLNGLFKLNDIITIDTRRGNKSITKTYYGIEENIINSLDNTSKWLQLQSGYNRLIQSADSGEDLMDSTIIYTREYQGV